MIAVIEADSPAPTSNNCSLACSEEEVGRFVGSGRRGRRRRGRARVGSVSSRAPQIFSPTKLCQESYIHAFVHVTWPMTRRASGSPLASALPRSGFPSVKYLPFTCTACLYMFIHLSEFPVQETNPHLCLQESIESTWLTELHACAHTKHQHNYRNVVRGGIARPQYSARKCHACHAPCIIKIVNLLHSSLNSEF